MNVGYDAESLVDAIRVLGVEFAHRRAELTQLDQEIGDGDHGENLARGFSAVLTKLRASEPQTPAKVLSLVATTLISTVGGASGPAVRYGIPAGVDGAGGLGRTGRRIGRRRAGRRPRRRRRQGQG